MLKPVLEEIKRPATYISLVVALLSILIGAYFSWYYYDLSIKQGVMYYDVQQIKAFDKLQLSNIKKDGPQFNITNANGKPITSNLYAATIKIWNGGNDEIKKSDIREPFKIIIDGTDGYEYIGIDQSSNNNRDGFKLDDLGNITWLYFDPNEGFSVRLLYASASEKPIKIQGYATNIKGPTSLYAYNLANEQSTATKTLSIFFLFPQFFYYWQYI